MTAKEFYRNYEADDHIGGIGNLLIHEMISLKPVHCFEYGCGSGKHLLSLNNKGISTGGIDISKVNIAKAIFGHGLKNVCVGDESYLRHYANYDIAFTVSVLDHVEDVEEIIGELKRIANKAVFLCETNDKIGEFYFTHDYKGYGFEQLGYDDWTGEDGAVYHIWKWEKEIVQ